ncbi:uncharacterized protein LOC127714245 [Mytilus californianus]|uniref:uncharacterized protein LOC127714245 n=1 Tax=Mytilus californianus TaxID=6549 RepID=UPI002245F90D|nr:uncharacterized protein LOC127714245 [Mytilus californianus]
MDKLTIFFCLLHVFKGYATLCYVCNSDEFPESCADHIDMTTKNIIQHTQDCKGSCFVGALADQTNEAHLRKCSNELTGCDKKESGFICQCSTDYCNQNLLMCHQQSNCSQELFPIF